VKTPELGFEHFLVPVLYKRAGTTVRDPCLQKKRIAARAACAARLNP
jgi:hypothetical protein